MLGDEVMAAALIDRLLHHCHIVTSAPTATACASTRTCGVLRGRRARTGLLPLERRRDGCWSSRARWRPPGTAAPWNTPEHTPNDTKPTRRLASPKVCNFHLPEMSDFRLPLTVATSEPSMIALPSSVW